MITVTKYSGRLPELGGIVNLVDQRRSNLSRSQRPPCRAKSMTRFDDDIPKQNSQSPEFGKKFQTKIPPIFLEISEFP